MVARISLGRRILGLLHYNEDKVKAGKATVLAAHGFGTDGHRASIGEKHRRFLFFTDHNKRSKLNTFHVSLNFSPKDQLDRAQLQYIAQQYMARIGFGNQPYLVYQHSDTKHPHLHIVSTNITREGKRIETHNLGKEQSEKARKELEQELGLVKAEKQKERLIGLEPLEKLEYGKKESKAAMGNVLTEVMRAYSYTSIGEFSAILRQFNIGLIQGEEGSRMKANRGLAYSILDDHGNRIGVPIKASAFYIRPSMARLEKRMERNGAIKNKLVHRTRETVDSVLRESMGKGTKHFQENLKKHGLVADFHYGKTGKVYGLTLIDHVNRTAFKASELSRAFSGQRVIQALAPDQQKGSAIILKREAHQLSQGPVEWRGSTPALEQERPIWKIDINPSMQVFLSGIHQLLRPESQELADPFYKKKKRKRRKKH
ncbi:relaxase/mobilization nuclease [Echinicola soli]|uniref:Relaxase/mobilization nuclease n=1 Tax=Echinicola soli TaxID=2591634 RepID=A0A514CKT4_9BACT|nr:relaxase/mobilization nuclease domain-containing protein [Echinicola soli]QDH80433.1 relaxase/mobilization nuclease [Echinicola soli]